MSEFPRMVAGRVAKKTGDLIDQAITRFKVTEGALVRAALEDFMPRYLEGDSNSALNKLAAAAAEVGGIEPAVAILKRNVRKKAA